MDRVTVIEKLRDDEEYYRGIGKNYLSNSNIDTLFTDPLSLHVTRPDNPNFIFGRYFHYRVLEPEKADGVPCIECTTRSTNVYKQFIEEQGIECALLGHEKRKADGLVDTINGNLDFHECINGEGTVFEEPSIGEIFGVEWKGKADILAPNAIYDLKTTADLSKFRYSVSKYNYDSQAFIYQTLFGRPMVFLAVEKKSGRLGMFPVSHASLVRGEEKVERAVEIWKQFYGPDANIDLDQYYRYEEV